jgi:type III secretion HrpO family protein
MYSTEVIQLAYQALVLVAILSAPPILISTLLGLVVAVFQAATQIQEQTLSFTVKLLSVLVTLFVMGGFLGAQIMQYAQAIFSNFYKWS